MKKLLSAILILSVFSALLTSCSSGNDGKNTEPKEEPTETTTEATTTTTETTTETTKDRTVGLLKINGEEIEIRIMDMKIEDEILSFKVDGLNIENAGNLWRHMKVYAVEDGEEYFLEKSHADQTSYTVTSDYVYEKLPEQIIFYDNGNDSFKLVYDVAKGEFLD